MYQFKSKETEDAFMRWIKHEALSNHPNDTELFYEFILGLCLNEDRLSSVIFQDLIDGQTNIWKHRFTETDIPKFINQYEDLYQFYHFLKKKSDISASTEESKPTEFEDVNDVSQISIDIQSSLKNIEKSIQDFEYKDKINKELHEELQNYKAGLREEFIKPILKAIIREYDRAVQQYEFYKLKEETAPQNELFVKLLKEFNVISLGLLDILDDYNLEPFTPNGGDDFSFREHKILKVVETTDLSKDSKIEKCVKCGFKDIESGKLLRQAEINIYKTNNNE